MTPLALALLVSSCAAWSVFDLARKLLADRVAPVALLVWLSAGQAVLLAAWCSVQGWPAVGTAYLAPGLGSITLNVAGNLAFLRALTLAPYSLVMPLLALSPVVMTGLAIPLLHELPQPRQLVGIALIVAGALALNWPAEGLRALASSRGAMLMAGVAAIWALCGPCDKLATQASSPAFHGFMINAGMLLAFVLYLGWRRELATLETREPLWLPLAIAAGTLALVLQLATIKLVVVSLYEAIKRMLGLVAAVVLGRVLFAEPLSPRKLAAIATMAAGLAAALI